MARGCAPPGRRKTPRSAGWTCASGNARRPPIRRKPARPRPLRQPPWRHPGGNPGRGGDARRGERRRPGRGGRARPARGQPRARSALHLRQLRRRQAQRVRLCLRPAGGRAAVQPGLQPAVPVWRRRPRQDPSDARHRLGTVGRGDSGAGRAVSVAYMSAEKFMYRFIAAIRSQSTMEFKEQLRSVDVLMIDDLQFLIGKDNTQEEFFHTFNALVDAGKQIVVSADKSPSDLVGPRGPAAHPARLRHGGRPARHHLRTAHLHPGGQGGARRRAGAAARCWSSWRTRSPPTCASWKAR